MNSQVPAVIIYPRHVTRADSKMEKSSSCNQPSLEYVRADIAVSHKCLPPLRFALSYNTT